MGWTKGLGADLTLRIEDMVEPTVIFEIEPPVFEAGWPLPHFPAPLAQENFVAHDRKVHLLVPVPAQLSTNYSPADHRTLSILSYFHAVFPPSNPSKLHQVCANSWNTALPLCAHPPYEVDWTVAFEKIVLAGAGMEDVIPSEIRRVLNGAIVGLVSCDPSAIDIDMSPVRTQPDPLIPYVQGSSPPSPSTSVCHGLALIRAVSSTSTHMHIITPLSPHVFARSRVLVKGELELPVYGMLDYGVDGGDGKCRVAGIELDRVPYLQWGKSEGVGTERRKVRRNLMRKGQM